MYKNSMNFAIARLRQAGDDHETEASYFFCNKFTIIIIAKNDFIVFFPWDF